MPWLSKLQTELMKFITLFLKLLLLLGVVLWISQTINFHDVETTLLKTNKALFIIAFLANNLSTIFFTIKWQRLASPLRVKSNFTELLKLNYISIFYSSFLPGQFSGELIKGIKLAKKENAMQKVWVPIFIDKITNLLMIFIIGAIAILLDQNFRENKSLIFLILFFTILFALITILLFSETTQELSKIVIRTIMDLLRKFGARNDILKDISVNYIEQYKKHKYLLAESLLWSMFTKLPHVFSFYFLSESLSLNLNLLQCAWLFSVVSIITLIPISFSGLGIREGALIVIFSKLGIEKYNALSFSLLIFILGLLIAFIGGLLEVFSHETNKNKHKSH